MEKSCDRPYEMLIQRSWHIDRWERITAPKDQQWEKSRKCPENARKMLLNCPERKYSPLHYGDFVTNGLATRERHVTNDVHTNLQSNSQIN